MVFLALHPPATASPGSAGIRDPEGRPPTPRGRPRQSGEPCNLHIPRDDTAPGAAVNGGVSGCAHPGSRAAVRAGGQPGMQAPAARQVTGLAGALLAVKRRRAQYTGGGA